LLPALIQWLAERNNPFSFNTQVSINIADDAELLSLMVQAGFHSVFIGIETPNAASLHECSKAQNEHRNMLDSVKIIQKAGLEVQGGFIVGFDSDPDTIFDDQIKFIQESGIATAMVGLLNAMKGTRLYLRLKGEHRLVQAESGDNTDGSLNFTPVMSREALLKGYRKVVSTIYSPAYYYKRIKEFLSRYVPPLQRTFRFRLIHIMAFLKSVLFLGIIGKERTQYWKLLFWTMKKRPRCFPLATTLAIYGFHYRKVFKDYKKDIA